VNLALSSKEEEDMCCLCKSSRFFQPDLNLLVGPCLHKLCETCFKNRFAYGNAKCPSCQIELKKIDFQKQVFEDLNVDHEVRIRMKYKFLFCKREEDFPDLNAYNDYLEEMEDIVYKLTNNIDVNQTKEKIRKFELDNETLIANNRKKQRSEELQLMKLLAKDEEEKKHRLEQDKEEQLEEKRLKIKIQNDFLTTKDPKVLTSQKSNKKKKEEKVSKELNTDTSAFRSYFEKIHSNLDFKDQVPEINDFNPLETTKRWVFDPSTLSHYRDFQAKDLTLHSVGGYQIEVYFSRALEACMSSLMRD